MYLIFTAFAPTDVPVALPLSEAVVTYTDDTTEIITVLTEVGSPPDTPHIVNPRKISIAVRAVLRLLVDFSLIVDEAGARIEDATVTQQ